VNSTANKTLIIAEAGVNHNGSLEMAMQLVDVAAKAGADWVKFQTFSADRLVTRSAPKAGYQVQATGSEEGQYEMLHRLELSEAMHRRLIAHCAQRNIGFLSTGFDIDSIDLLISLGTRLFKVPSGEITNLPYLRHVGKQQGEVILSTGMATLAEIEAAITVLEVAGCPREKIIVLHCTTEYPAPMIEVNLLAIQTLQKTFGVRTGYSDHTLGIEVAIAAVALGALVIEKHFTLDRTLPGPDHKASLEPLELQQLVRSIRNVEAALGDGIKRPTVSELRNRPIARKSIVAACEIRRGELLTADKLSIKRPGTGLSPMLWDEIVGRAASADFAAEELIRL
jgi:N,N'-diacetyllegionaminate synthase